jgi:hypothetical protein
MVKKKSIKPKKRQKDLVNETRRHTYDAGARRPLTEYKLVPISVVMPVSMIKELAERGQEFINPRTMKPYGRTALARICIFAMLRNLHRISENRLLEYLDFRDEVRVGRTRLSDEEQKRIPLLIPQDHVTLINDIAERFASPLIGTTTIVRYCIHTALKKLTSSDFYKHLPDGDKIYMFEQGLTIKALIAHGKTKKKAVR